MTAPNVQNAVRRILYEKGYTEAAGRAAAEIAAMPAPEAVADGLRARFGKG